MKRMIVSFGTFASIVSLSFSPGIPLWGRIIIVVIGVVCLALLIVDDVKSGTENEKICHSEGEIKDAMKALIRTQGKVCIMSRDLSWVDAEVEECIAAKRDSVKIFAEKETELTKRLVMRGVIIKYYGGMNFEPKSRFTILHYNRDNPQVAIASTQHSIRKKNKYEHLIYETKGSRHKQDKWINSLAMDMITLCDSVAK